jgi:hypothetical protein
MMISANINPIERATTDNACNDIYARSLCIAHYPRERASAIECARVIIAYGCENDAQQQPLPPPAGAAPITFGDSVREVIVLPRAILSAPAIASAFIEQLALALERAPAIARVILPTALMSCAAAPRIDAEYANLAMSDII